MNDLDDVGVIPRVLNELFLLKADEQKKDETAKFSVVVAGLVWGQLPYPNDSMR
jgi:hypothetical protein